MCKINDMGDNSCPYYDHRSFHKLTKMGENDIYTSPTLVASLMIPNMLNVITPVSGVIEDEELEELEKVLDFTIPKNEEILSSGFAFDTEDIDILSNFLHPNEQLKTINKIDIANINENNPGEILELDFIHDTPIEMLRKALEPQQKRDHCSVIGCEHISQEGDRCIRHHECKELCKTNNNVCGVEGCSNVIRRKGYCLIHTREIGSD